MCWMREARRHGGQGIRGFAGGGRGLAQVMHWETRRWEVGDGGGSGMERGQQQVGQVVKTFCGWVRRDTHLVQRHVVWVLARARAVVVRVGVGSSG